MMCISVHIVGILYAKSNDLLVTTINIEDLVNWQGIRPEWSYPFCRYEEAVKTGRKYKSVKNGRGTELMIAEGRYISVGVCGTDITIRGDGKVLAFDDWTGLMNAIDEDKAV